MQQDDDSYFSKWVVILLGFPQEILPTKMQLDKNYYTKKWLVVMIISQYVRSTWYIIILKSTRLAIYSISSNWFSFHLVDLAFIWKSCWHLMKIVWKHCSDWNIFNIIHSTSSELQVLYWECLYRNRHFWIHFVSKQ